MGDDNSEWAPIRDAAAAAGVAPRTVYGRVERGSLVARQINGTAHVRLADVEALAARSQAQREEQQTARNAGALPANGDGKHDGNTSANSAQRTVDEASARIERARLEAEELRARDATRRARADLDEAAADRERRRAEQAVALERGRLDLTHAAWRLAEERRVVQVASEAEDARARRERARREAERLEAAARAEWVRTWERAAANWAALNVSADTAPAAIEAARGALNSVTPEDEDSVIETVVVRAVTAALADRILARWRLETVEHAVAKWARDLDVPGRARVRARAEAAANAVRQRDDRLVATHALEERERVCAERRAEEEERRTARAWAELHAELPRLVARKLPQQATGSERETLVQSLRGMLERRPGAMTPGEFAALVRDETDRAATLVEERLRRENWQGLGARLRALACGALPRAATQVDLDVAVGILTKAHADANDADVGAFERKVSSLVERVRAAIEQREAWDRERAYAEERLASWLRQANREEIAAAGRALEELIERHRHEGPPGNRFRAAWEEASDTIRSGVDARLRCDDWSAARSSIEALAKRRLPQEATPGEIDTAVQSIRNASLQVEQRGQSARTFLAAEAEERVRHHVRVVERRVAVDRALDRPGVTMHNRDRLRRVAEEAAKDFADPTVAGAEARDAITRALEARR